MIHRLKILDEHLDDLISGKKKVEIRRNDRNYRVDDELRFQRNKKIYYYNITHVHKGLGLLLGYVALSLEDI